MLSFGLKKYGMKLSDKERQTKRQKYDTNKLHSTNPITMERSVFTFEYSIWYCNYVTNPSPECSKWSNLFRRRCRMPFNAFLDLALQCEESILFDRWSPTRPIHKYNKSKTIPLKLLLLSSLRYLGRGWTFDDLHEATAINPETMRLFFHKFIEYGSSSLYNKYVLNPTSSMHMKDCEEEF